MFWIITVDIYFDLVFFTQHILLFKVSQDLFFHIQLDKCELTWLTSLTVLHRLQHRHQQRCCVVVQYEKFTSFFYSPLLQTTKYNTLLLKQSAQKSMSSSRPWNMVWPIFCINSLSLLCICDKSRLIERNFHNMFLFFLFQSDDQSSKKGAEQFDAKWFRQSILRYEEKSSAWSQLLKSGSVRSMRRTLLAPLFIALAIQITDR